MKKMGMDPSASRSADGIELPALDSAKPLVTDAARTAGSMGRKIGELVIDLTGFLQINSSLSIALPATNTKCHATPNTTSPSRNAAYGMTSDSGTNALA